MPVPSSEAEEFFPDCEENPLREQTHHRVYQGINSFLFLINLLYGGSIARIRGQTTQWTLSLFNYDSLGSSNQPLLLIIDNAQTHSNARQDSAPFEQPQFEMSDEIVL